MPPETVTSQRSAPELQLTAYARASAWGESLHLSYVASMFHV